MAKLARLNDTSTHGGKIITAAAKTYYNGRRVARVTDTLDCPIHGPNPIVEGSGKQIVEGQKVAREGDHTACGAALVVDQATSEDE